MTQLYKITYDVVQAIDEALTHYEVWWALNSSIEEYKETFNHQDYTWFMEATLIANQMAMFMALGRLFDPDTRTSSIKSLKNQLKENNHTELYSRMEQEMSPYRELVKKILNIRCSIIAHSQTDTTDEEVILKSGVIPNELRNIINSAKQVVGEIAFKSSLPS